MLHRVSTSTVLVSQESARKAVAALVTKRAWPLSFVAAAAVVLVAVVVALVVAAAAAAWMTAPCYLELLELRW